VDALELIPHIPAGYDWDDDVELVVALDDGTIREIVSSARDATAGR
jgi:hypothetical protein